MLGSRTRCVVTLTAVIEATLAGWALGRPFEALLLMVLAVTAADTVWGMTRRGVLGDLAGVELAAALGLLLAVGADGTLTALVACCCAAWLVGPQRQEPFVRPTGARGAR